MGQVEQDHLHSIGNQQTVLSCDNPRQDSLHKLINVYSKQDRGQYPTLPYTICHSKGSRKGAPPSDLKALFRVPLNQEMKYWIWELMLQQQVKQIPMSNHVKCFTHVQQAHVTLDPHCT